MSQNITAIEFEGIGWKTSVQQKRGTTRYSVKKDVAVGLALDKGHPTFGYLGRDLSSNRKIIIYYPDGKKRDGEDEVDE